MLANHVIQLHAKSKNETNFVEPDISAEDLKKYVTYAKRRVQPRLNREAADVLQGHYISIRQKMAEEKKEGGSFSLPITVRQLEAICRISEALARMELTEEVAPHHVEEAMRLFTAATLEANSNHKCVEVGEHERKDVKVCEDHIK
eukprot:gene371-96_t